MIRLITDDVLFGLGKYVLRPEGYPLLTSIAHAIQPLPNAVRVEGYTDTLPCSCFFGNEGLSFARADTVLHFLGSHGFTIGDRHDAVPVAYGEPVSALAEQRDDRQPPQPPGRDRDPAQPVRRRDSRGRAAR